MFGWVVVERVVAVRCVVVAFVAFLCLYPSSWLLCLFVSRQPLLLAAGVFDSCAFVSGYVPHTLSLGRRSKQTNKH